MNTTKKTIALAFGGAFALSIAATSVNAASNPFAFKSLASGYQVADATVKATDGKCSAGKCGANKKMGMEKAATEKAKEGTCSADKAAGTAHTEKAKEGACSADKAKTK